MMREEYDRRRRYITQGLRACGLDCATPDGAFYVMLVTEKFYGKSYKGRKIKGSMDVADLLLTEKKVAVTPSVCFGDDTSVRLSYALSLEDMVEGLEKIGEFIKEIK